MLQVTRTTLTSGALSLINVTPLSGAGGQNVTILGQGFSSTPASNMVKFNGTSATVVSATPSALMVTVPPAATTGLISVTVGGTTVQGPNFTVTLLLVSIAINPASPSIPIQEHQQFTATGTFSDNSTEDVSSSVTWNSSVPGVLQFGVGGQALGKFVRLAPVRPSEKLARDCWRPPAVARSTAPSERSPRPPRRRCAGAHRS